MKAVQQLPTAAALRLLHAFTECGDAMQGGVKSMLRIIFAQDTTEDEKAMALHTVADLLYPKFHKGKLGMDLEESESDAAAENEELREIVASMNAQEVAFSERVRRLMKDRGVTQNQLAEMIGVGQPAISNILNRTSRPQFRTVERIAKALNVEPSDLWTSCP
jgi:DNA-binding Xre family transcriptional regulator